jgi:hypothetical protein
MNGSIVPRRVEMKKRTRCAIYMWHTEFNVSYCDKYLSNEYGSTYF